MRAAVQWSYGLLTEDEQWVFRRLSVFAGGFTARSAAAVTGERFDEVDILNLLDGLVARSMVSADTSAAVTRYRLLETLRLFADDALGAAGEKPVTRRQHASHYVEQAESWRREQMTAEAAHAHSAFSADWDNLRAALEWSLAAGDAPFALRLVIAAYQYAMVGFRLEFARWAERAIDMPDARAEPSWPAAAGATALLRWEMADAAGAHALAAEAVAMEQRLDVPASPIPHLALGVAAGFVADRETARHALERAEQLAGTTGDLLSLCDVALARASLFTERDLDTARELVRSTHESCSPYTQCNASRILLLVAARHGDIETAEEAWADTTRLATALGDRHTLTQATGWLAWAYRNDTQRALALLRQALIDFATAGAWAQDTILLREALRHLTHLQRHDTAGIVLGALERSLATSRSTALVVAARNQLTDALGPHLDARIRTGQGMSHAHLIRIVVAEIDALTTAA